MDIAALIPLLALTDDSMRYIGAGVAIGIDTVAASALDNASAQGLEVTNETTAPSAVSFSTPTTKATGLSLGDIPAGQVKAFWIRRTASNSAAKDADGATISVEGDSAE